MILLKSVSWVVMGVKEGRRKKEEGRRKKGEEASRFSKKRFFRVRASRSLAYISLQSASVPLACLYISGAQDARTPVKEKLGRFQDATREGTRGGRKGEKAGEEKEEQKRKRQRKVFLASSDIH